MPATSELQFSTPRSIFPNVLLPPECTSDQSKSSLVYMEKSLLFSSSRFYLIKREKHEKDVDEVSNYASVAVEDIILS